MYCSVSQSHPFPAESRWKSFSQKWPEAQQNPASFSSASPRLVNLRSAAFPFPKPIQNHYDIENT